MKRSDGRLRLCGALLALNLLFIWGNSLLPGSVSAALSGWVQEVLAALFPMDGSDPSTGHGLLRKLAHLGEFTCLGALLAWLCAMLKKPVWLTLCYGFPVAGVDELIQRFIPDRVSSLRDVAIDTIGILLGIALLHTGYGIYRKKKH